MGSSTTQAEVQFKKIIDTVKMTFGETSERTVALLKFYTDFEERIKEAPASGKLNYHNAYEGGYVDHICNVLECAKLLKRLYEKLGGIIDFTDEELVFAALHHDVGKLGLLNEPYYVIQDSEWHRINKLEVFKHNDDVQYMGVNDRSIFVLQQYGIKMTQAEYLAIRLADGLYDKANEKYLLQYGAGPFPIRCNLIRLIHWADHMAANIEQDIVRQKLTR